MGTDDRPPQSENWTPGCGSLVGWLIVELTVQLVLAALGSSFMTLVIAFVVICLVAGIVTFMMVAAIRVLRGHEL